MYDPRAKSWKPHYEAEDGYVDADLDPSTVSQDNLPLASNIAENRTNPILGSQLSRKSA